MAERPTRPQGGLSALAGERRSLAGRRLRTARAHLGAWNEAVTLQQMAGALGLREVAYGGYERGRAQFPPDRLDALAGALGMDLRGVLHVLALTRDVQAARIARQWLRRRRQQRQPPPAGPD